MKKCLFAFCFLAFIFAGCSNQSDDDSGSSGSSSGSGSSSSGTSTSSVVEVTSNIGAFTTWTSDKTYYVANDISVQLGGTLSIEAGTIVKFSSTGSLLVEDGGVIVATGTAAKPVYFTSFRNSSVGTAVTAAGGVAAEAGNWQGVIIQAGSIGSSFSHCVFSYGGKDMYAVLRLYGSASIDSCTFRDNLGGHPYISSAYDYATLDAHDAQTGTKITNNLFYRNLWPLAVSPLYSLDDSNTFSYDEDSNASTAAVTNTYQGIYMNYGDVGTTVSWNETEVPICFFNNVVRLLETASVTIASGAVIKNLSSEFIVEYNGVLNRTGVVFTSFRDDACIGDTNGDGTVTSPLKGDWTGIQYLTTDGFNYASGTNIRYASEPTD